MGRRQSKVAFNSATTLILFCALASSQSPASTYKNVCESDPPETDPIVEERMRTDGQPRRALLIANETYESESVSLDNPVTDICTIAERLLISGFDVDLQTDLSDNDAMEQAVERFADRLNVRTAAFFYYAGHGMQIGAENYLIPTGFRFDDAGSDSYRATDNAYRLSEVLEILGGVRFLLVALDACRDNAYSEKGKTRSSGFSQGLAKPKPAKGQLVFYATEAGNVVSDESSLFAEHFSDQLAVRGLAVNEILENTRERIRSDERNTTDQRPALYNNRTDKRGDFQFLPADYRTRFLEQYLGLSSPSPSINWQTAKANLLQACPLLNEESENSYVDEIACLWLARAHTGEFMGFDENIPKSRSLFEDSRIENKLTELNKHVQDGFGRPYEDIDGLDGETLFLFGYAVQEAWLAPIDPTRRGVGFDDRREHAKRFYEASCNVGFQLACNEVATEYLDPRDRLKAYDEMCNTHEFLYGCVNLATLYLDDTDRSDLSDDQRREASEEAFALYDQSCEKGVMFACTVQGTLYAKGAGVQQDRKKAEALYKLASSHGEKLATTILKELYKRSPRKF